MYVFPMKSRLYGIFLTVVVLVMVVAYYKGNYFSYYNCLSQTKFETITQKGIDHISAVCRAFVLEKLMVK